MAVVSTTMCSRASHGVRGRPMSRREGLGALVTGVTGVGWLGSGSSAVASEAGRVPGGEEEEEGERRKKHFVMSHALSLVAPSGEDGFLMYTRPKGKTGGHGVGWSEFTPYKFLVPDTDWKEVPVSIADLGGTELDLRYTNAAEGSLAVVVAPQLRFINDPKPDISMIGPPDQLISAFSPEIIGGPLDEGQVVDTQVVKMGGRTSYIFELKPHVLVSMTTDKSRLYILSVTANSRQWRNSSDKLKRIQESFALAV